MGTIVTLAEAMLETGRVLDTVHEGAATSGTTAYLKDTNLKAQADEYAGGTLWMLSGSNSGTVLSIKTSTENTLALVETLTIAIAAADKYAILSGTRFKREDIRQAVRWAIKRMNIPKQITTLKVAAADKGIVTMPTGINAISNIKQVFVDDSINKHWAEINGTLVFDDDGIEGSLRVIYVSQVADADLEEGDYIAPEIDLNYLIWSSAVNCWRKVIQQVKKDDPTAVEMMNEAKSNEQISLMRAKKLLPKRSIHFANW